MSSSDGEKATLGNGTRGKDGIEKWKSMYVGIISLQYINSPMICIS